MGTLSTIIAIAGWVAAIVGWTLWSKVKRAIKESKDVYSEVVEALDEKSPGGEDITTEEWKEIALEAIEAVEAWIPVAHEVASKLRRQKTA